MEQTYNWSKTRNNFIDAFSKLYEHQDLKDISVAQLCETAGYSRSTFYRQFDSLEDVLHDLEDRIIPYSAMKQLLENAEDIGMREITDGFLKNLLPHHKEFRILFKRDYNMHFFQKCKAVMKPVFQSQVKRVFEITEFEYGVLAEYISYAKLSLLRIWAISENNLDLAYLTKITDATFEGALWDLVEEASRCKKEGREFKRITLDNLAATRPWIAYRYG